MPSKPGNLPAFLEQQLSQIKADRSSDLGAIIDVAQIGHAGCRRTIEIMRPKRAPLGQDDQTGAPSNRGVWRSIQVTPASRVSPSRCPCGPPMQASAPSPTSLGPSVKKVASLISSALSLKVTPKNGDSKFIRRPAAQIFDVVYHAPLGHRDLLCRCPRSLFR